MARVSRARRGSRSACEGSSCWLQHNRRLSDSPSETRNYRANVLSLPFKRVRQAKMPSAATGTVPGDHEATKRLVIIEDPILNSPFDEPSRHFKFTEDGITNQIIETRRTSAYFIPVPRPRNRRSREQLVLDTEWTADRLKENDFINKVR